VVRRVRTFLLWLRRPDLKAHLEDGIRRWQDQVREVEVDLADRSIHEPEQS
jgi:hypothetical protein